MPVGLSCASSSHAARLGQLVPGFELHLPCVPLCHGGTVQEGTVQRGNDAGWDGAKAFQSQGQGCSVGRAEIFVSGGLTRTDPCCQPFHSTITGTMPWAAPSLAEQPKQCEAAVGAGE